MKKIFECIVGSHAYGTNIETSDIDIKGVYIQPNTDILGTKYVEQVCEDKDTTYYEVRRFLELAGTANPTILEMMFIDPKFIKIGLPQFRLILENRKLFLTKHCLNSFGGFAVQQIKKARGLNKKMNWEKDKTIRKTPIDFCYIKSGQGSIPITSFLKKENLDANNCGIQAIEHMPSCYNLYYDWSKDYAGATSTKDYYEGFGYKGFGFEDSNDLRLSSIPKEQADQSIGVFYYNKDAYSIHCKEFNQYQTWLENRNTQRYVDVENHNQKVDGKNLMHCMRLINCGLEIAETGDLQVYRPERQELLDIRQGKVDLEQLIEKAEIKLKLMEEAFRKSSLPDEIEPDLIHNLLIKIRCA